MRTFCVNRRLVPSRLALRCMWVRMCARMRACRRRWPQEGPRRKTKAHVPMCTRTLIPGMYAVVFRMGPYWGPRWPKMAQDGPKMAPRWPKLAPRWPQDGPRWPQDGPKMAQDGPKMAQDGPKMAQDGPKMAQDGPKMAQHGPNMGPRWLQDGPKMAPKWPDSPSPGPAEWAKPLNNICSDGIP